MPTILITRPQAMAEALAARLQKLGYETVTEPLLSVRPLDTPMPETGAPDAIMITSANALLALRGRQGQLAGLFDTPCFCVGTRTADAARHFGFRHVQNAKGDGAELATLINCDYEGREATILHIAGREVSAGAGLALTSYGHHIAAWAVYDTIPAMDFTPLASGLLMQRKIDAVTIFSPKTAGVLCGLITKTALEACCGAVGAICLSEAVAVALQPFPWRRIVLAPQPTEDALIASLQQACPVQS